ncbi:hypothetical protein Tco_0241857 [Tanacetum coccineum]
MDDNDIYFTVDACPNACEMWKAIERLKQGESINVQDLETNLYWEFGKFTSRDGESRESYYSRFYKMMNELVRNQCDVTNHQVNVQFLLHLQPEWQRAHQDNTPRINRGIGYDNQRAVNVAGARDYVGNIKTQKCKRMSLSQGVVHCVMQEIQEVTPDAADNSRPIFDTESLKKVQNDDDNYNVFANDREHPEQPESDDDDLARERDFAASLMLKLKCEIDDNKNRNKLLESSNKTLVDKLKDQSEVQKKEQAYNEEQYAAARCRMLSIPFVDEDDYIPLGDIIGSVENLVPIPSEFEGISDDTCDVPTCDNNRVNVESDLVESLINRDTSIVHSSKIDPILEEFAGELAHIAPIPPGIVEADFDPNDDTSSDDDSFENIEYVDASPSYSELDSLEEENEDQEEKEFNLEDIFQIQDVILREKLLNVHRLISNIESLKDKPTPDRVLESLSPFPIPVADSDSFLEESDTFSHLDNSLPEFEISSDYTEETRSGNTTTHANYSLLEYDSFLFVVEGPIRRC